MSRITGSDAKKLMEAYTSIYTPQEEVELTEEQVQEDFENWVNSLVEEGHDLSEYTWEDMYEEYLNELQQLNPQQLRSLGTAATKSGLERTFAAGGGRAALMKPGATFQSVFAQGSKNLRTQQKPSSAPVTRTPAATTQRPAAPAAARPAAPVARPATTSNAPAPSRTSYAGATGVKPVGTPLPTNAVQPVAAAPTQPMSRMAQQTAELRKMRQASQQRQIAQGGTPATPLVQSFDLFDIVMGHLIDEGYADSEEAALQIMANMSEEWRQSIVEAKIDAGKSDKEKQTARSERGTGGDISIRGRRQKRGENIEKIYRQDREGNPTGKYSQMQHQKRQAQRERDADEQNRRDRFYT